MREIRLSGSEGGVAQTRHPYPYRSQVERRIYAAERGARRNLSCARFTRLDSFALVQRVTGL